MRPAVIIEAIHNHTVRARVDLLGLIRRTRREPLSLAPHRFTVRASSHGFVTWFDLGQLKEALNAIGEEGEIILLVRMGAFVAFTDPLAEIRSHDIHKAEEQQDRVRGAIHLERSRDITHDPSHGIQQLEIIAWSAISPAKANIVPGIQTVFILRNLLARWAEEEQEESPQEETLAVVYSDDVVGDIFGAYEALAIIAANSGEFHVVSEILNAFSSLYDRLPLDWQDQAEHTVLQILPRLKGHYLSRRLADSLAGLMRVLVQNDKSQTAERILQAYNELQNTFGSLEK
jgi:uncharacterized membrane protein